MNNDDSRRKKDETMMVDSSGDTNLKSGSNNHLEDLDRDNHAGDTLKTLKNLKNRSYCEHPEDMTNPEVCGDCLKAEAIKHYKAIKKGGLIIDVLTYIRWANDLSEEDLEDE